MSLGILYYISRAEAVGTKVSIKDSGIRFSLKFLLISSLLDPDPYKESQINGDRDPEQNILKLGKYR